jgi:hypothetical protein
MFSLFKNFFLSLKRDEVFLQSHKKCTEVSRMFVFSLSLTFLFLLSRRYSHLYMFFKKLKIYWKFLSLFSSLNAGF